MFCRSNLRYYYFVTYQLKIQSIYLVLQKSFLIEGALLSIRERVYEATIKLLPTLLNSPKSNLYKRSINAAKHNIKSDFKLKRRRCLWDDKTTSICISRLVTECLIYVITMDTPLNSLQNLTLL